MEYKDNGDFIECWGYYEPAGGESFFGAIREEKEIFGYFLFHPARKITIGQHGLVEIAKKLGELNQYR